MIDPETAEALHTGGIILNGIGITFCVLALRSLRKAKAELETLVERTREMMTSATTPVPFSNGSTPVTGHELRYWVMERGWTIRPSGTGLGASGWELCSPPGHLPARAQPVSREAVAVLLKMMAFVEQAA